MKASVNKPLLAVAALCALAAAIVAFYVAGHPYIPEDATIERDIQSTNWGPLTLTFPVFSWIGDAKGAILEATVFVLVMVFNRRAWILAAAAALTGLWYVLLSHLINRPRPTTAQVLQVTEHPSASSFPSGHTIFVLTVMAVLIILANAISRVYTGAHWPTDVLAGLLIAAAWLSFVVSLRWISDRAFAQR